MIDFIIKDFPVPPSVNKYLMPVMHKIRKRKNGKLYATGVLAKTPEHRNYESTCQLWALSYQGGLSKLKAEITQRTQHLRKHKRDLILEVEYFILLPRHVVLTINNLCERVDSDNYLKPTKDNLFKILNLDDKCVFKDSIQKVAIDDDQKPCVIIAVKEYKPLTSSSVKSSLGI